MARDDLDNGRLICLIGVAPLRPAEFVIFSISRWTAGRNVWSEWRPHNERDGRYVRFNFLLNLGDGVTVGPTAGLQEVGDIRMEVTVSGHCTGDHAENNLMKITGRNKSADVTFKRVEIDALKPYDAVRARSAKPVPLNAQEQAS